MGLGLRVRDSGQDKTSLVKIRQSNKSHDTIQNETEKCTARDITKARQAKTKTTDEVKGKAETETDRHRDKHRAIDSFDAQES
jgi:hypothetical protein